jgi:hypothetical protein
VEVHREKDLAEIPLLQISTATSSAEKVAAVVKNRSGRGHSRPREMNTLKSTINALLTRKLGETERMSLVTELEAERYPHPGRKGLRQAAARQLREAQRRAVVPITPLGSSPAAVRHR